MSRNYKFHNPNGLYFVSFAVVGWLDVFTRNKYKELFLESLQFCQKNKGMEIHAWCIMPSHIHLIFRSIGKQNPEQLLGDLKRFTSKQIVKEIAENPQESRRENLIASFKSEALKNSNTSQYQFWRHDNKPIELWSNKVIFQKIQYIHNNPVVEGFVSQPEEYLYSSARDYAGKKGLLDDVCVFQYFGI
ncbi:REP-associated tyrosine transposase [Flavobacterium sp.]|jgi:REP element-mobilizing transposase RayT|uniref:REP-associated tyrosine transposase n=1 Tax=Flavobacterium sp. TaxID=239 RepID=UPI0022C6E242|nr:transposase [Flavobacterium sp.]MCZ8168825.1 transposase [Flavobacterium sp.]